METPDQPNPRSGVHGIPFRKLALQDRAIGITLLLLVSVMAVQAFAISSVFWLSSSFGRHFDGKIFWDVMREKSETSLNQAFKMKEAMLARENANRTEYDNQWLLMKNMEIEHDLVRARQAESMVVRGVWEKKADESIHSAAELSEKHLYAEALIELKNALTFAPDYLPAIREMAILYEQQHDYPRARFQWQKAVTLAPPQSDELSEIQGNLIRVIKLDDDDRSHAYKPEGDGILPAGKQSPPVTHPRDSAILTQTPTVPMTLRIVKVTRDKLPYGEVAEKYDICFKLEVRVSSSGADSSVDMGALRIAASYYDQYMNSDGDLVALKVSDRDLPITRKPWKTGDEMSFQGEYSRNFGGFRESRRKYGNTYGFCGYVVRVYYGGQLQHVYAEPASVLERYSRIGTSGGHQP